MLSNPRGNPTKESCAAGTVCPSPMPALLRGHMVPEEMDRRPLLTLFATPRRSHRPPFRIGPNRPRPTLPAPGAALRPELQSRALGPNRPLPETYSGASGGRAILPGRTDIRFGTSQQRRNSPGTDFGRGFRPSFRLDFHRLLDGTPGFSDLSRKNRPPAPDPRHRPGR